MADGAAVDGVVSLVDGPPAGVAAEAGGVEGPPRLLGPHHVAADGLAALGTSLQKFLRQETWELGIRSLRVYSYNIERVSFQQRAINTLSRNLTFGSTKPTLT